MSDNDSLSERELEILKLVATGASNKEIARKLNISTNTVKVHLRNIFAKIGAASRTEAAMYAVNSGFIQTPQFVDSTNDSELVGSDTKLNWLARYHIAPLWFGLFLLLLAILLGIIIVLIDRPQNQFSGSSVDLENSSSWQAMTSMPTPRFGMGVVLYEDKVYAIAGESKDSISGVVERYTASEDAWERLSSKPTQVTDVGAAVIGGKIYVPGGKLINGEVTDILEIYNPRLDEWGEGSPLPEVISAYALVAHEGKLYLFGGWNNKEYLNVVLEYDPDLEIWTYKTPFSVPRAYAAAVQVNGIVYLMGRFDGKEPLKLNERYSPNLDDGLGVPWSQGKDIPTGLYGMGIASILDNIYLVGGLGNGRSTHPAYGYSTSLDQWQVIKSPEPQNLSNIGLVAYGTNIYSIGGKIDQVPTANTLSYQVIYVTVLPFMR